MKPRPYSTKLVSIVTFGSIILGQLAMSPNLLAKSSRSVVVRPQGQIASSKFLTRGRVRLLRKVLRGSQYRLDIERLGQFGKTRAQIRDAVAAGELDAIQYADLIESTGLDLDDPVLRTSRAAVPYLVVDTGIRRAMKWSVLRDLNSDSERLLKGMKKAQSDGKPIVMDVVRIGAGVHNAIAANAASQENPNLRQLIIEETDVVTATFSSVADLIQINSSSRAEDSKGLRAFGGGNNNPIEGPVQVPQIDGNQKWPTGDALATAATFALAASDSHIVMNSRFESVEYAPPGSGGRFLVKFIAPDGKTISVITESIVFGTGLGQEDVPVREPQTRQKVMRFLQENRELIASGEYSEVTRKRPQFMTYLDAMKLSEESEDPIWYYRTPYTTKKGKRVIDHANAPEILVIGGGDSGKTELSKAFGLSPEIGFNGPGKIATNQTGAVENVDWAVPGSFRDCNEYADTTRARYVQLAADIKAGRIKPLDARVSDITKIGERSEVSFTFEARQLEVGETPPIGYTVLDAGAELQFAVPEGLLDSKLANGVTYQQGRVETVEKGGVATKVYRFTGQKQYDVVVSTVGFTDDRTPKTLQKILPNFQGNGQPFSTRTDVLERVMGSPRGAEKPVAIAKRVKGENIYFIGPAAGNDLVERTQTVGISENLASIKFLGPYSAALGRSLASIVAKGDSLDFNKIYARKRRPISVTTDLNVSKSFTISPDIERSRDARWVRSTGLDFDVLRNHELAQLIEKFDVQGLGSSPLRLVFGYEGDDKFTIQGPFSPDDIAQFRKLILDRPALLALIRRTVQGGAQNGRGFRGIEVTVPTINNRGVILDFTAISTRPLR